MSLLHFRKFSMRDFIAEIGVNHENSMDRAFQMIEECAALGIGTVKFQSYKSEKLAAENSPSYWDTTKEKTTSQRVLFSKYDQFKEEQYSAIAKHCEKHDIEFLTTPFDTDYVTSINGLVERFKIASVDLTNNILLKAVAATGKPIVMSTGASTLIEIREATKYLETCGATSVTLLHCITKYPTPVADAGLEFIEELREEFAGISIGYSDHTVPEESQSVLLAAIAAGASVIEKHYTFDKTLPGNDHYHAFDYEDAKRFKENLENIKAGIPFKGLEGQENAITYARRGMYSVTDLSSGHILSEEDVIPLRPQLEFIPANQIHQYFGKPLKRAISGGEGLSIDDF